MSDISQRKLDHIDLCLNEDVAMAAASTGFDRYHFLHQALPELALSEISLATTFLGRQVAAPIMIASMTGGPERGETINRNLAIAAEAVGVPMGVGSQRIMLERPEAASTFTAARKAAPGAMILGNMGAVQLNYGVTPAQVVEVARAIGADGLYLHLNALQEAIQPGGDTDFRGLLARIAEVCQAAPFPVLAKEVGSGIAPDTARALVGAGVSAIDVSGAGGTSWAKIEAHRAADPTRRTLGEVFESWGIPTTESLQLCREALPATPLVASGGMRTGLDAAKAIALGADMVSFAMPLLGPATRSAEEVEAALSQILAELRLAMFLVGAKDIASLRARRDRLRRRP